MSRSAESYEGLVDDAIGWAAREPLLRALWIEGRSLQDVRRPYKTLELHLAADEPDFLALAARIPRWLAELGADLLGESETVRRAREFKARLHDLAFTVIAEQTCFLAKRPRAHVTSLLDKTGHLTHVMDFFGPSGT